MIRWAFGLLDYVDHLTTLPAVLIGDLTLARPLGMAGIPVTVVTTTPHDVTLRSRFVRNHVVVGGFAQNQQAETVATLCALGKRLGQRVPLIYGADSHIDMLYRYRQVLEEHYLFILNDADAGLAMFDKELFSTFCAGHGVLAPATVTPKVGDDLEASLASLRDPLLVKPRRKTAWRELQKALFDGVGKARIFDTRQELLANPGFRAFAHELLVQEHLGSDPRDVYSFHGFADAQGRVLGSFCGRKIRTYPVIAGESSCIEVVDEPRVDALGHELVGRLSLKGPFKFDLIRDHRSGQFYTLEVNCRFTLWSYVGAAHGVNLPALTYHHLISGESHAEVRPTRGGSAKWVNIDAERRAFRELHAEGQLGWAPWLRTLAAPSTLYEVFAWNDPLPAAFWLGRSLTSRLSR